MKWQPTYNLRQRGETLQQQFTRSIYEVGYWTGIETEWRDVPKVAGDALNIERQKDEQK